MSSNQVDFFLSELSGEQRLISMVLDDYLTKDHGLVSKIRYKIPFYFDQTWLCYLSPLKNGKIDLAFINGVHMLPRPGLFIDKNRKQVRSIQLSHHDELDFELLNELLLEAKLLQGGPGL